MIAAAVEPADLRQRELGHLAGQVDRDLAGSQRGGGAAGADQLGAGDAEALGDPLLDLLDRGRGGGAPIRAGITSAISSLESGLAISEAWARTRVRAPWSWRTLASIRPASSARAPASAISTPDSRTRRRRTVSRVARFGGSTATVRPHSKRSRRRVGEGRELARDAVGREDQLAARLVEGVEGVEELLLGGGLALEELDVVDQQHVEVAVAGLEGLGAGRAQGGDELVGERLGGRVADAEAGGVGAAGSWRSRSAGGSCRAREGRGGRAGCRPRRGPRRRPERRRGRAGCRRR